LDTEHEAAVVDALTAELRPRKSVIVARRSREFWNQRRAAADRQLSALSTSASPDRWTPGSSGVWAGRPTDVLLDPRHSYLNAGTHRQRNEKQTHTEGLKK
jgi:hypothetical protein